MQSSTDGPLEYRFLRAEGESAAEELANTLAVEGWRVITVTAIGAERESRLGKEVVPILLICFGRGG